MAAPLQYQQVLAFHLMPWHMQEKEAHQLQRQMYLTQNAAAPTFSATWHCEHLVLKICYAYKTEQSLTACAATRWLRYDCRRCIRSQGVCCRRLTGCAIASIACGKSQPAGSEVLNHFALTFSPLAVSPGGASLNDAILPATCDGGEGGWPWQQS